MLIKKSALALTTAISLLALAPAYAEDMTGVSPDCIMKNADGTEAVDKTKCPDGKTMSKSDNSTDQMGNSADQMGNSADQMGSGNDSSAATDNGVPPTDNNATAADQAAPAGSDASQTQMDQAQTPATPPSEVIETDESGATAATDQNMDATQPSDTANVRTSDHTLIVPADEMTGATIMSASDFIGKRVYDKTGNDIGEVNDLIISDDGKIQATILGVGGFLGIGEKDVAVAVSSVEMVKDGDSVKLVINATKDQLEQAPTFDPKTRNYAS